MRNQDIHKGFENTEVRDFFAKTMEDSWGVDSVASLETRIASLQELLATAKQNAAVQQLVKCQGWEDWDVSDKVPYNEETYFPFIGTESEFEKFLVMLNDQEEE